jgi:hypothetical protein
VTAPVLIPTSSGPTQLASATRLQVNVAYDQDLAVQGTAEWATVYGLVDFSPGVPQWDKVDTTTYDNADPTTGIVTKSQIKVAQSRTATASRNRVRYAAAEDNEGWETLYNASRDNRYAEVRWFNVVDTETPGESAIVDVTYDQPGGAPADLARDNITMELQGPATSITNPQVAASVPNATSVAPTSAASLTMVVITGTDLIGTSAVTFGGVASPLFEVVNATTIEAVVPTTAAGSKPIAVTGPGGTDGTTVAFTVV